MGRFPWTLFTYISTFATACPTLGVAKASRDELSSVCPCSGINIRPVLDPILFLIQFIYLLSCSPPSRLHLVDHRIVFILLVINRPGRLVPVRTRYNAA